LCKSDDFAECAGTPPQGKRYSLILLIHLLLDFCIKVIF
jgi:hypothetical protein